MLNLSVFLGLLSGIVSGFSYRLINDIKIRILVVLVLFLSFPLIRFYQYYKNDLFNSEIFYHQLTNDKELFIIYFLIHFISLLIVNKIKK